MHGHSLSDVIVPPAVVTQAAGVPAHPHPKLNCTFSLCMLTLISESINHSIIQHRIWAVHLGTGCRSDPAGTAGEQQNCTRPNWRQTLLYDRENNEVAQTHLAGSHHLPGAGRKEILPSPTASSKGLDKQTDRQRVGQSDRQRVGQTD